MDYIALGTYLLVMIVTPGPNNIMVTASGANFGYRRTLPHICGIICGGVVQIALSCFGLAAVFMAIPFLHDILSWVGLTYMFYLAWKMLGLGAVKEKKVGKPLTLMQAAVFQLVNPKAWIIVVTIPAVFIPKDHEILMPTLFAIAADTIFVFMGTTAWAMFGSSMRRFLKNERNQLVFNIIMAGLLVITAVMIIVKE